MTTKTHENAAAFIQYLKRYAGDRGALAALRGALSDARRPNAWPILASFRGGAAVGHTAYETVAGLWAHDPVEYADMGNLGQTVSRLSGENNSFEGRFKRLLTCDKDEIAARVAPVVRAAQAKGLAVNYARLLSDLLWWNERTKVDWAKAFWGAAEVREDVAKELYDEETPTVGGEVSA